MELLATPSDPKIPNSLVMLDLFTRYTPPPPLFRTIPRPVRKPQPAEVEPVLEEMERWDGLS